MDRFKYFANNKEQYISLISDILALEIPDVILGNCTKNTALMTTVFDGDKYIIQINYRNVPDDRTMVAGLTHEMRHIYQIECIKQKAYDLETEEMINLWKGALAQYADSGVKDYDLNLLELDANAFTKWMMCIIFNNDNLKVRVEETTAFVEVYDYIKNCFPEEDINDCLAYFKK